MQATKQLSEASVVQSLFDDPQRFQFAQAVCLLLRWLGQNGLSYERILAEVLRFENSLSLEFPASEIAALEISSSTCRNDSGPLQLVQSGHGVQVSLTPSFFGLLGVTGALPLSTTERIAEAHRWAGDEAPHAFMNLFSHRLTALYFKAWAKNRLEHMLDVQGEDCQLPLLVAIAGVRQDMSDKQQDISNEVIGYYAGLLGTRPMAASSLSRILTRHFGVDIEIEPFVALWDDIPASRRSKLGSGVARIGHGATLGRRINRRDICIRLIIGPLEPKDVERFLPGRSSTKALSKLISLFGLADLKVAVRLLLRPSCIRSVVLTSKGGTPRRLGWDAFLVGRGGKVSRDSIDYLLQCSPAANGS